MKIRTVTYNGKITIYEFKSISFNVKESKKSTVVLGGFLLDGVIDVKFQNEVDYFVINNVRHYVNCCVMGTVIDELMYKKELTK